MHCTMHVLYHIICSVDSCEMHMNVFHKLINVTNLSHPNLPPFLVGVALSNFFPQKHVDIFVGIYMP